VGSPRVLPAELWQDGGTKAANQQSTKAAKKAPKPTTTKSSVLSHQSFSVSFAFSLPNTRAHQHTFPLMPNAYCPVPSA
jgi:hypothetical protein